MPVTDAEITSLADTRDIITLGARADDVRRERHDLRTTFVRVAIVGAQDGFEVPASAGEVRITGAPGSVAAATDRIHAVAARANRVPVSGYSLADLEELAASEAIALRALLVQFRQAGLELVGDAAVDRLRD